MTDPTAIRIRAVLGLTKVKDGVLVPLLKVR